VADDNTLREAASALPYGDYPVAGVATAGQPPSSAWRTLAEAGFRTVLDLRPSAEPRGYDEPAAVAAAGLEYVQVPVTPVTLGDADFDRVREVLRESDTKPVVFHCASANRVGGLLIPYLVLDEKRPLNEAVEIAQRVGLRAPQYASMALDYVKRHSGEGRAP